MAVPGAVPGGAEAAVVPELAVTRQALRAQRRKNKQKRNWLDRVLLGAVVFVSLLLVLVGAGYGYVQYRFHQVSKVTVKHLKTAPVGKPFNVLLIGSDSRLGESSSDASHFGSSSVTTGQRSDVVKILHVDPATGQIRVLSIPRDTVIAVAGDTSQIGKYNRINATYNNGPDQLVQTIEADFGIPISHVVQIDFEGFRGAVDAIGGIWLNFPYPAKDVQTGLDITTTGCQHVNGGYSLAVARSRDYEYYKNGYWQYDGTGDYGRIVRQNAFLKALINQAETKYNPLTLNAFIGSVVQGVTIDSTFNVAGLISLAREFHAFASTSLVTATLPTYGADSDVFGYLGSVLYVQQPAADQVIAQFLGEAPETVIAPPPDPYGSPATTTTTSTTEASSGGSTPPTNAPSTTTTTIPSDFDPTPCTP
ncbi:MAG TPA: LCP family protein [Acidimicrobiales bacterium]|nr:LCP family protein [Acidimicrobiales bacterium]